jgi:hypothetical protein
MTSHTVSVAAIIHPSCPNEIIPRGVETFRFDRAM